MNSDMNMERSVNTKHKDETYEYSCQQINEAMEECTEKLHSFF